MHGVGFVIIPMNHTSFLAHMDSEFTASDQLVNLCQLAPEVIHRMRKCTMAHPFTIDRITFEVSELFNDRVALLAQTCQQVIL